MLEPEHPSLDRLSFQAWLQADGIDPMPSPAEQQALQYYLIWQAACEEANTLADPVVEPLVAQVYQRLGIEPPVKQTATVATEVEPKTTWWERLGFSQWVAQPMGIASAAMVLIAVLGTSLILHYQPQLAGERGEVEITRSVTTGQPNPIKTKSNAPIYTLAVTSIEPTTTALIRDLTATHFTITEVEDLGVQGKIMTIRSPEAPLTQSTRQILQHYQLESWLNTPNTTIRLHLKAGAP